jgi:heterodisulfide reductase subunit C2
METINLTNSIDKDFIEQLKKESGEDPALCYQCGNCTAGCPYTQFFDYPVSQIMRLIQAGQRETVLNSKAIWLCATCETCTTRCPCQIDVAHIMDTCRNIAFREKRFTEKEIKTFYESFLVSVRKHGRMYEMGTLTRYNLLSGHPFTMMDVGMNVGPKIMTKGLIHPFPKNIKGRAEVARIFEKFANKRRNHGR